VPRIFLAIGDVRYAEAWLGSGEPPGGRAVFPRDHPSFPLPREGEGTEGEREVPPPGVRGKDHDLAEGETDQVILCRTGPPTVIWGPGRAKTLRGGSAATHRQRIDPRVA
jgi:hypothetical protein